MSLDNRAGRFPDQNINDIRKRARSVSAAREYGLELIDEERMRTLLVDLDHVGMIDIQGAEPGQIAKRAMEILRG